MGTRSMIPELGLMHFHGKATPETRRGAADVGTKTGLGSHSTGIQEKSVNQSDAPRVLSQAQLRPAMPSS